jgi:hypothetical protein
MRRDNDNAEAMLALTALDHSNLWKVILKAAAGCMTRVQHFYVAHRT